MDNDWKHLWQNKKEHIQKGKELMEAILPMTNLSLKDAIILLLTENKDCIKVAVEYLDLYKKQYKKDKIYVISSDLNQHYFSNKGYVEYYEVDSESLTQIATYLSLFDQRNNIIFMCDNDSWGGKIEYLLNNNFFSLEEYVAIGVYGLKSFVMGELR